MIEIATGNMPGNEHCPLDLLLEDASELKNYKKMIDDSGLKISALSCHGNPLHPDEARSKKTREVFRKTIQLAEKLEVSRVINFSGCPG